MEYRHIGMLYCDHCCMGIMQGVILDFFARGIKLDWGRQFKAWHCI